MLRVLSLPRARAVSALRNTGALRGTTISPAVTTSPLPHSVPVMATITVTGGKLNVPNDPTIPFIEGDGTGPDIWKVNRVMLHAQLQPN